jgi:hypothetical protein
MMELFYGANLHITEYKATLIKDFLLFFTL